VTDARSGPRLTSGRDALTPEQRSLNMSRVRSKDTKPEMLIRKGLHAAGLRYRLHGRRLPGTPDLIFPGPRAVVFVHGCFWHGHHCPMFRLPATRAAFWSSKIAANQARDTAALAALSSDGWRVLTIWECALRGRARRDLSEIVERTREFLVGDGRVLELEGAWQ
jgi:DNA mismatch endonuclease, patch repair protein